MPSLLSRLVSVAVVSLSLLSGPSAAFARAAADELRIYATQPGPTMRGVVPEEKKVKVLSITLENGCLAKFNVESLTVHHAGFGNLTNLDWITLKEGETLLAKGLFNPERADVHLKLPSYYSIAACENVVLDVYVDFTRKAVSGASHTFLLRDATNIVTSHKKMHGVFPIRSAPFIVNPTRSQLLRACLQESRRVPSSKNRANARQLCRTLTSAKQSTP